MMDPLLRQSESDTDARAVCVADAMITPLHCGPRAAAMQPHSRTQYAALRLSEGAQASEDARAARPLISMISSAFAFDAQRRQRG